MAMTDAQLEELLRSGIPVTDPEALSRMRALGRTNFGGAVTSPVMDVASMPPPAPEPDAWAQIESRRGSALPRAVQSVNAGDSVTQTVSPGQAQAPALPMTLRQRAEAMRKQITDMESADEDMSGMQAYMRQRGQQGGNAMLNALAAQFAGESFQPVQAQYLKRAMAAQDPMKIGTGMLTPDGQFIVDPFARKDKKVAALEKQAATLESQALAKETEAQRREDRLAQQETLNEFRRLQLQYSGQNAETARMMAGGGALGAGAATQIGSGPNGEPIMRNNAGQLFTYSQQGQAIPFQGTVAPKLSSSEPTEDERKAAGWFAQANNAVRNIEDVTKTNPRAAYPSVSERVVGTLPVFGEDIANTMRSEDRQKFVQAASSMSEALLRAATGAGVNESEARQKAAELTPQLGDKPGVVKQKMDAYKVYMDSLKTRAGRAMRLPPGSAPPAGNVVDFNSLPK